MNKLPGLLLCLLLVSWAVADTIGAEDSPSTASIRLEETLYNVQLIVTGEVEDTFEVNLIAPDGAKYVHANYAGQKALYFKLPKARIWLLNEAMPGEYRFEISGSSQAYKTSVEKELRKPITTWLSPAGETIALEGTASLQLAWKVEGDADESDVLKVYLKPAGGWQRMQAAQVRLKAQNASIRLPATVQDGEYELILVADNKTPEGQTIPTNTKIKVQRGYTLQGFQVMGAEAMGDQVRITMKVSNKLIWKGISASFEKEGATGPLLLERANRTDLYSEADKSDPNSSLYEWDVDMAESGKYKGSYQVVYEDWIESAVQRLPEFELRIRDWSKDTVAFLTEAEKTNLKQVQIRLKLQADAHVQVVDGGTILYDQKISADGTDQKALTIQVPLLEGDRLLQAVVGDSFGNIRSFPKRYLVDFTPPLLTMIQPQGQHSKLEGGFASGFVEKDSVILVGGQEHLPDRNGYFRINHVNRSLDLTVRDSHGNETRFQWSSPEGWSKLWLTFVSINVFLVGLTAAGVYWIRKKL
ncbi:hypothetical protein [Paenibacillus koleovorans]|uniref:hypothetical protein n=1 Tax=Paenibacillus koleovorans TaxID=121608 RepID=UPI000FD87992|nr:hypothetical protein [Paenibacillus koleovorans]